MPLTCKTPAGTGASRDSFAGLSLRLSTPFAMPVQLLIAMHHVRPELAAMLAILAYGGHGQ